MAEDADLQNEDAADTAEETDSITVLPAPLWPVYNVDRARAELLAFELLTKGASYRRVRQATRLSPANIRRLANLAAEEAANPVTPRIVGRSPARVRVRNPADPGAPRSASPAGPGRTEPTATVHAVQMTLSLDC